MSRLHKTINTLLFFVFVSSSYAQQPGAGYALNFDGINDLANANGVDLTAHTNNFTIEFWARPTATRTSHTEATSGITGTPGNGQRHAVFASYGGSSNAGVGVSVGTNGVSVYEHGAGYMPALLVYDTPLSGWNHIAVVYIAKQPRLYINGILVHTGLTSLRTAVYPSGQIGGHAYGYYAGDMDEFRIWSSSRTQAQIRDNLCKKLIGNEAGLVRYLRIDDGAGTTVTDATGTRNGTMSNMTPATDWILSGASIGNTSTHNYATPWTGFALDFDGINDRVNGFAGDLQTITDNFTMEMWVKPTGTITIHGEQNCNNCISGTGTPNQRYAVYPEHGGATPGIAGAGISVGTNGVQVYEHAGGYMPALASHTTTISDWTHIAVVYTAKQPTIYINGVAVRTGLTSIRTAVFPGAQVGGAIYGFYQGQIDDYRVWNHSRTANQISSNMCAELTGSEAGLVRYYKFNTGSGTTATDATATRNGTLINMVPASDWVATGAGACSSGSLILQSPELDSLGVSNISGFTKGFHIYHVDAVPNTTTGIVGLGANDHYYGVFKAGVITPTTYTATYYYDENDAWQSSGPHLLETDLALFTRSDNTATPWANVGAALNIAANTLTAPAQSTEFILGITDNGGLPIKLTNFNAIALNNKSVSLDWQTATEINNDYFSIEKSIDGKNWELVENVNGAGNSSATLDYSLIDNNPYSGISYYRLKQTDYDSKFTYSNIRTVNIDITENISIFPNPTTGIITIVGNINELKTLEIYNLLGQNVTSKTNRLKNEETKVIIDLSSLKTGVYFVKTNRNSYKIGKQ